MSECDSPKIISFEKYNEQYKDIKKRCSGDCTYIYNYLGTTVNMTECHHSFGAILLIFTGVQPSKWLRSYIFEIF